MSQRFSHWLTEISGDGIFSCYTFNIIRSVIIISSVIMLIISSFIRNYFLSYLIDILLFVKKIKFFVF